MSWTLLALAGCGENHFARTDDWLPLDLEAGGQATIEVSIQTEAEAWPPDWASDAVKVAYYTGPGREEMVERVVIASPEGRETLDWPGALNVLDAWRGCEEGTRCQRSFPLEITCDHAERSCRGGIHASAYLSTYQVGQAPAGTLRMRLRALD